MRDREGLDPEGRGGRKEVEGIEGGETGDFFPITRDIS